MHSTGKTIAAKPISQTELEHSSTSIYKIIRWEIPFNYFLINKAEAGNAENL